MKSITLIIGLLGAAAVGAQQQPTQWLTSDNGQFHECRISKTQKVGCAPITREQYNLLRKQGVPVK